MTTLPSFPAPVAPARAAGPVASPREIRALDAKRAPISSTAPTASPLAARSVVVPRAPLSGAAGRAALSVGDVRPAPMPPRVLDGAAIEPRFRYWYGRSGRRYLFSEVDGAAMADLDDAVILIAGRDGERPLHVGTHSPAEMPAGRLYVHLLAKTEADRADIVADLAPPRAA